jgi:hypothetical protein
MFLSLTIVPTTLIKVPYKFCATSLIHLRIFSQNLRRGLRDFQNKFARALPRAERQFLGVGVAHRQSQPKARGRRSDQTNNVSKQTKLAALRRFNVIVV